MPISVKYHTYNQRLFAITTCTLCLWYYVYWTAFRQLRRTSWSQVCYRTELTVVLGLSHRDTVVSHNRTLSDRECLRQLRPSIDGVSYWANVDTSHFSWLLSRPFQSLSATSASRYRNYFVTIISSV